MNKKYITYFILLFAVKLVSCFYLTGILKCGHPEVFPGSRLAIWSGDAYYYLEGIENYVTNGKYIYYEDGKEVIPGRAPYYGAIYFLLRLIFNKPMALDGLVIFQLLLECISIVVLSILCEKIIKKKWAFPTCFLFMAISLNSSYYSYYILTESFSTSFLIFFSFCYYEFLTRNRKLRNLLMAGLFLSIVVLLKPYFVLLFVFIGVEFILRKPFHLKLIFQSTFVVSVFLIILHLPYTIHNYRAYHKIIPGSMFRGGWKFTKADDAFFKFLSSWGGSFVTWDYKHAGSYFSAINVNHSTYQFPEYVFTKDYDLTQINLVRDQYIRFQLHPNNQLEDSVALEFNRMTQSFKQEHTFRYYFITPVLLINNFLFHSGTYYLPFEKGSSCYSDFQLLVKLAQSFLYWLTLIAGFIGLFLLLKESINHFHFILIPLFIIALFPVWLKATEYRYFVNSYPYMVLGLLFFAKKIFPKQLN